MTVPDALRVRRYLDGAVVDETMVTIADLPHLADQHVDWSFSCSNLGLDWLVVIDDPDVDVELVRLDEDAMYDPMVFVMRMAAGLDRLYTAHLGRPG